MNAPTTAAHGPVMHPHLAAGWVLDLEALQERAEELLEAASEDDATALRPVAGKLREALAPLSSAVQAAHQINS